MTYRENRHRLEGPSHNKHSQKDKTVVKVVINSKHVSASNGHVT